MAATQTNLTEGRTLSLIKAALLIWLELRSDFLRVTSVDLHFIPTETLDTEPIAFMNRLMLFVREQMLYITTPGEEDSLDKRISDILEELAPANKYPSKLPF